MHIFPIASASNTKRIITFAEKSIDYVSYQKDYMTIVYIVLVGNCLYKPCGLLPYFVLTAYSH